MNITEKYILLLLIFFFLNITYDLILKNIKNTSIARCFIILICFMSGQLASLYFPLGS